MNNNLNDEILDKEDIKNLYENDMLKMSKQAALSMEQRILNGEVIKDYTTEEGERILLTRTENNTYGYAVYEKGKTEPHYLVESHYLFTDFEKQTAHNGTGLRYGGAKSRIQRNMLGLFFEYIKDYDYESLYASIQMPKEADVQVSQQMTGYYNEDPVTLMAANFDRKKFSVAAFAQNIIDPETGKPTIRVGLGGFTENGSIDVKQMLVDAKLAESAKKFLGQKSMEEEKLKTTIKNAMELSQSTFYSMYKQLGISVDPNIKPNNLIEDSLNKYIQNNPGKFLSDESIKQR